MIFLEKMLQKEDSLFANLNFFTYIFMLGISVLYFFFLLLVYF